MSRGLGDVYKRQQQRVNEAVKLGCKTCILPGVCLKNIKKNDKIEIIGVNNVQEAIKLI